MKGEGHPLSLLHFKEEITMAEAIKNEKEKTVKIRIPKFKANQEDVFVSVNDRTWIVKRGVEVDVPECVAEVIRHSEEMLEKIL
jgi:hypothetical protein